MSPRVVGLDLSLTSAGWAQVEWPPSGPDGLVPVVTTGCIESKAPPGLKPRTRAWYASTLDRIRALERRLLEVTAGADLIVVEAPALHAKGKDLDRMFGLWWMCLDTLTDAGLAPVAVCTPTELKIYMTGKGTAPKDAVLAQVIRRLPGDVDGFDQADALAAAALGCDHLGCPLATMPARNRTALSRVDWPNHLTERIITDG